jgi:hypothetical protein
MTPDDEIFSPPVGMLRESLLPGLEIDRPIYACRHHTMDNPMLHRERLVQVLMVCFGELMWINVSPTDVITMSNSSTSSGVLLGSV